MKELAKSISCCSKTAENRAYAKRLGSRLLNNAEVGNASVLVDGCSNSSSTQRRCSPRLHKNIVTPRNPSSCGSFRPNVDESPQFYPIVSSPEPCVQGTFIPKFRESLKKPIASASSKIMTDSETLTPNIRLNFQSRLSPRLNRDAACKRKIDACENSSASIVWNPDLSSTTVSQMQPRLSPRLHQTPKNKSKEPTLIRRLSPRLHCDGKKQSEDSAPQRRMSPRLHSNGQNEKQKLTPDGCASGKRSHSCFRTKDCFNNAKRSRNNLPNDDGCESSKKPLKSKGADPAATDELQADPTMGSNVLEKKPKMDGSTPVAAGTIIHARLKTTLRIFNAYYLQFLKEEEERCKKRKNEERNSNAFKSKDEYVKQTSSRPDLKAISKMNEKKEILYPDKRIGHIPGIEVGYQFFSRAEMVAIGFHSHWLNGIDYIGQSFAKMEEHGHYTFPIAVSIVMSGQYEDDLDNSEDIIYTGQGGHDLVGSRLQCADQVLLIGNLAMKNSMEQSVPVRVIRGHRSASSYTGKIYTYDGLYKVVDTLADKGQRGHLVYKYHLKRIDGQPKLTTNKVQFVRGFPASALLELPGLVCRDISNGQEAVRIPVTNLFDDALIEEGFTYIKTIEVADGVNLPPSAAGCACKGSCTNPKTCACAKLNGSDFPYVRHDGGRLVEAKDVVFECGPRCSCGPGCLNRTSQRGVKYHLEVYRTPDKGWAVRSRDFIPSGAPVCEYIGLLRRSDEVDNISGNDYIFEIDCLHTMNEIEGRERRFGNVPLSATNILPKIDDKTLDSAPEFCLDAGSRGNVARFINHSCEPNLFVQCILSSHHDLRLARVVLFAADNIPPLQELTYDYGYALDSVIGADGKVKVLPCFCGTADCRRRLY